MKTVLVVVTCHFLFLLALRSELSLKPKKEKPAMLRVQTIALAPPPPPHVLIEPVKEEKEIVTVTSPLRPISPPPVPKKVETPPTPKKVEKKKPLAAPKKPTQKPTPTKKTPAKKTVLAEVEESIAKIGESSDKSWKPKITFASADKSKKPTTTQEWEELSYQEEVALHLKASLRLPEYGQVKIHLTLKCNGKVAQVAMLSTESQKNGEYIKKSLPSLVFPPFGDNFKGEKEHTFTLTLCNDA